MLRVILHDFAPIQTLSVMRRKLYYIQCKHKIDVAELKKINTYFIFKGHSSFVNKREKLKRDLINYAEQSELNLCFVKKKHNSK